MNEAFFYKEIQSSTAHRLVRDKLSGLAIENPEFLKCLIFLALNTEDKSHHKACWILELVLEEHIEFIFPYLNNFCHKLPTFSHEGAIRSISKICMFLAREYLKKEENPYLGETHLHQISEKCFDWLISDTKVASKAYAMRALFEIGKIQDWIYPELTEILIKDYADHSSAYQAASKDVLRKIKLNKTKKTPN